MQESKLEYAGFWIRFAASLVDTVLLMIVTIPLTMWLVGEYSWQSQQWQSLGINSNSWSFAGNINDLSTGWYILLKWVLPCLASILFWLYRSATPGKMLFLLKILDIRTCQPLSVRACIVRYIGYYISAIPLCLGFIWVAFNPRKQGWHDLLAHSVVVRPANRGVEAVHFEYNNSQNNPFEQNK